MYREKLYRHFSVLLLTLALFVGLLPAAGAAETISLSASGAIVINASTGETYFEKDADTARPVASMTKLMSFYLVFEEISAGRLTLDSMVTASANAAAISNDPIYSGLERLTAGKSYQVDTLLRLVMTSSCNGSIVVLAEHIGGGSEAAFVQKMNSKAKSWGINACFADSSGFLDAGNAVSPQAMAYIAQRLMADYPKVMEYAVLPSLTFQGKTFKTTNNLLTDPSCPGVDGLKTGFTYGAGYCFTGTAQRNGTRLISVVMNAPNATKRMAESKLLLNYGFMCSLAKESLTFDGYLNVSSATIYPGAELTVSAVVRNAQGMTMTAPVRWQLDGQAIPGYSNSYFVLSPGGKSSYLLKSGQLTPGSHTLSFAVNPDGLPGMETKTFSLDLTVLPAPSFAPTTK